MIQLSESMVIALTEDIYREECRRAGRLERPLQSLQIVALAKALTHQINIAIKVIHEGNQSCSL